MKLGRRIQVIGVFVFFVVVALLVAGRNTVWPFSEKKQLTEILGRSTSPWLEGAEIAAWQPDLNRKPQAYLIVRPMSEGDFQAWAKAANLVVSKTPNIPSGIFAKPEGLKLSKWLDQSGEAGSGPDAHGTTPHATVWSRLRGGTAYSVVHPTY